MDYVTLKHNGRTVVMDRSVAQRIDEAVAALLPEQIDSQIQEEIVSIAVVTVVEEMGNGLVEARLTPVSDDSPFNHVSI